MLPKRVRGLEVSTSRGDVNQWICGIVTDVNPSKIKLKVAMEAFRTVQINVHNYYLIILTPSQVPLWPKLSGTALARVENILSLPDSSRSSTILNTPKNRRLYRLLVAVNLPSQLVVPPADLLQVLSSTMRYVIPNKQRKYKGEASFKSSSNPASQDVPKVVDRSKIVITQPPKKLRVEERWGLPAVEGSSGSSRRLDKRKGAAPAPEEPLHMRGSRYNDHQFLIPDVVDHHLDQALCLSPRFSLPIQAIYTYCHQALKVTLQNYLELETLLKKDASTKASEEELTTLHAARTELVENLELETAKV
ncbi:hypothetical protein L484_015991 [Morus notabilis]|uniref:Uncharacterized protein n=1 Tax=Morus notabilis TaxID=981085 RepID=W9RQZ9_9ROSA|nr:hypothetical protein L484_015991 [Morus notabilis]